MKSLESIAFDLGKAHQQLIRMVQDLENQDLKPPPIINDVMEAIAESVTGLYFHDQDERQAQVHTTQAVLLRDTLQVMTMLYQAVYDGKVLFQHDQRRVQDVITQVEIEVQTQPKIYQLERG